MLICNTCASPCPVIDALSDGRDRVFINVSVDVWSFTDPITSVVPEVDVGVLTDMLGDVMAALEFTMSVW